MQIQSIENELAGVQEEVKKAEGDIQRSKGRTESLLASLEKEYGLTSTEEIEKQLEELQAANEKVEKEIVTKYTELKERYDW